MDRRGFLARLSAAMAGLAVGVRATRGSGSPALIAGPAPDAGIRQELSDVFYMIGPAETPFISNARGATYDAWNAEPVTEPDPVWAAEYNRAAKRHRAALARLYDGTKVA